MLSSCVHASVFALIQTSACVHDDETNKDNIFVCSAKLSSDGVPFIHSTADCNIRSYAVESPCRGSCQL